MSLHSVWILPTPPCGSLGNFVEGRRLGSIFWRHCLQLPKTISLCSQNPSEEPAAVTMDRQTVSYSKSKTFISAGKEHGLSRQKIHHMRDVCTVMLTFLGMTEVKHLPLSTCYWRNTHKTLEKDDVLWSTYVFTDGLNTLGLSLWTGMPSMLGIVKFQ